MRIRVIGGGLAGPEAALTAARLGCDVDLYEMRAMVDGKPRLTPAHQTIEFGELVCSNSLKSESPNTAPWLLKQEMRRAGSALLRIADESAVPAGHALAVDRVEFSRRIAEAIAAEPGIRVIREEVTHLDSDRSGDDHCHGPAYLRRAERRDPAHHRVGAPGLLRFHLPHRRCRNHRHGARLLRRPLGQGYCRLHQLPHGSRRVRPLSRCCCSPPKPPSQKNGRNSTTSRGACRSRSSLGRGRDTLRFGPMKPVGLRDPRTGMTAVGSCPTAKRKPARRQLQPRGISKSLEVRGAGPRPSSHSRP